MAEKYCRKFQLPKWGARAFQTTDGFAIAKTRTSGGARVFAARGKRLCCRLRHSDQFCSREFFRISDMGCEPTLEQVGVPSSSVPSHSLLSPFNTSITHPFLPLEIGPLNPARRPGSVLSSPVGSGVQPQPKLNLVHFSLKI